jgi:hypothetical protein
MPQVGKPALTRLRSARRPYDVAVGPPSERREAALPGGPGTVKPSLIGRPGWAAGLALFFLGWATFDFCRQVGATAANRSWIPALLLIAVAVQTGALTLSGRFARRDRVFSALLALLCATFAAASAPGLLPPGGARVATAVSAGLEFAAAAVCGSALIARQR